MAPAKIKRGLLELCILNLLLPEAMYGYQIVKRLASMPDLVISIGTHPLSAPDPARTGRAPVQQAGGIAHRARTARIFADQGQGRLRVLELNGSWNGIVETMRAVTASRSNPRDEA